jgi:ribosomal protein L37AE/L43A
MRRIHTTDKREKWQFACPTPKRHRDWRVVDGLFECRSCRETFSELVDLETGERVAREEVEIVGAHADHKGQFGRPTVE